MEGAMQLLVVSLLAAYAAAASECPRDVITRFDATYLQVVDGTCYNFVVNEERSYNEAESVCEENDGTLALPKTQAINDYLTSELYETYQISEDTWIGLHDKESEANFVWEDDTELGDGWNNFASGNGVNGYNFFRHFEDCVTLRPANAEWHDYHCHWSLLAIFTDVQHTFVCQYPAEKSCEFECDLDCGMNGFKVDEDNCQVCECN